MKIALIGTGNVATHIVKRLKQLSIEVVGVLGSSEEKTTAFAQNHQINSFSSYSDLSTAELTMVCVQDDRLTQVLSEALPFCDCATTSGTYDISGMTKTPFQLGVFYPLQTFSKNAVIDFEKVPFFIESDNHSLETKLMELGNLLGKEAVQMNAESRLNLHVTAVFLNNFTHHICALGNEFAQSKGIELSWFEALIDETLRKVKKGALFTDQTGPAKRGDKETIQKHLQLLDEMKAKVYATISDSIYQKKNQ